MCSQHFWLFLLWKHKKRKRKQRKSSSYYWEGERLHYRWASFGGIGAVLDGVIWQPCNETCSGTSDVTLHPNVATLSPVQAPRVPHYPIVYTSFCSVSNDCNRVIYLCPTWSGEYALKKKYSKNKLNWISLLFPLSSNNLVATLLFVFEVLEKMCKKVYNMS